TALITLIFFFSSRRRHTRCYRDWSSDVCSSDLIFAPTQIAAILAEAKQLPPAGSLRPLTFYTLFGLVAACGLRISEALALQIDDIRPDGLYIRETKFRKSRLVPLHPMKEKQLFIYLDRRKQLAGVETRVFRSLSSKPSQYATAIETFIFLLRKLGVREGPGQPGPRLHDLRSEEHTSE